MRRPQIVSPGKNIRCIIQKTFFTARQSFFIPSAVKSIYNEMLEINLLLLRQRVYCSHARHT